MRDEKRYDDPRGNVYVAEFADAEEEAAWVEREEWIRKDQESRQKEKHLAA